MPSFVMGQHRYLPPLSLATCYKTGGSHWIPSTIYICGEKNSPSNSPRSPLPINNVSSQHIIYNSMKYNKIVINNIKKHTTARKCSASTRSSYSSVGTSASCVSTSSVFFGIVLISCPSIEGVILLSAESHCRIRSLISLYGTFMDPRRIAEESMCIISINSLYIYICELPLVTGEVLEANRATSTEIAQQDCTHFCSCWIHWWHNM